MKYQLFIIQCLLFINTIEYKIAEHNDYNVEVLSTTYNSITLSIYSNIGNKMGIYKGGILLKEFESDKLHPYIYRIKTSMFVSNHLCLTFFDN